MQFDKAWLLCSNFQIYLRQPIIKIHYYLSTNSSSISKQLTLATLTDHCKNLTLEQQWTTQLGLEEQFQTPFQLDDGSVFVKLDHY